MTSSRHIRNDSTSNNTVQDVLPVKKKTPRAAQSKGVALRLGGAIHYAVSKKKPTSHPVSAPLNVFCAFSN